MDQLPVRDQIQVISTTDILIGMHGAALAYGIFLTSGAGLIEIYPKVHFSIYYLAVAFPLYNISAPVKHDHDGPYFQMECISSIVYLLIFLSFFFRKVHTTGTLKIWHFGIMSLMVPIG